MIESRVLGPKTGPERWAGYQTNFPPTTYVESLELWKQGDSRCSTFRRIWLIFVHSENGKSVEQKSDYYTIMFWGPKPALRGRLGITQISRLHHTKSFPTKKVRKLLPNQVPDHRWQIILVDIIGKLPESRGYNALLVMVDHLSKCIHTILTVTSVDSEGTA